MLFGLVYSYLAIRQPDVLFGSPFLLLTGLAMLVGGALLAKAYFFRTPFQGICLSLLFYVVSWVTSFVLAIDVGREAASAITLRCEGECMADKNLVIWPQTRVCPQGRMIRPVTLPLMDSGFNTLVLASFHIYPDRSIFWSGHEIIDRPAISRSRTACGCA